MAWTPEYSSICADDGSVEDCGVHSDEAVALYGAAVDDCGVPDADAVAQCAGIGGAGVEHHVVLQAGVPAHGDRCGVRPDGDAVKGTRFPTECGPADYGGSGC